MPRKPTGIYVTKKKPKKSTKAAIQFANTFAGESSLSEEFSVPANPSAVHWDLTTSGVPIWDELMKDPKYYKDRKGMTAEVQWMTPDQYFDLLPKVFGYQYTHDAIKTSTDPKKVEKYATLMRQGVKFPMLWIEWWNAKEGQQEGRHRALAAEKAGIQFVPVIIIKRDQPKSNEGVDAVIDSLLETELGYYDIGHADDLGKSNSFLWVWDKGRLLSKPGKGLDHEDVFGNAQPQWFGRYDPSTKQVSITPFVRGKAVFKTVPNIIVKRLYDEYGDNITIHPFGCELSESTQGAEPQDAKTAKFLSKLRKADFNGKTELWYAADLTTLEAESMVKAMILSIPGSYKLHSREYGTNLVDAIYEAYGWMPSMFVDERMLLGMQITHPDRVSVSFTLGLDAIQIK